MRIHRLSFLAAALTLFAACAKPAGDPGKPGAFKVGLVFDVGGRGDKSFNDSAYRGLERAKKELGVDYSYIEPSESADRENALRQLAAGDAKLIIGIGFMFTDDVDRVAAAFPDKHFACIDYAVEPGKTVPPNVVALKFREQEGSFLAGVIAALTTKTKTVGFIGGMDVPLIHKFEAGYKAGVAWADPSVKVLSAYAGVTPEAFKDPSKGKELALAQYDQGADIIYHASGSTGLGVFEAARLKHKLAIGVDSDQYHEAPGYVLTSVIKNVDNAVFEAVKAAQAGRYEHGLIEMGLKDNGVDYVYDDDNKALIPAAARAKAEEARKLIIEGKLGVPAA